MTREINRRRYLKAATVFSRTGLSSNPSLHAESASSFPEVLRVGIIGLDGHYSEITQVPKLLPNLQITAMAEAKRELRRQAARNALLSRQALRGVWDGR